MIDAHRVRAEAPHGKGRRIGHDVVVDHLAVRVGRHAVATAARVEANLSTLKAAQDKRVKRKKREQGAAQDNCDARFTDNSKDIAFVDELRRSLEETGRLDKPLTRGQLMMVMRAKRIPLPQRHNLEFLRNKLKEVDEELYDANMAAIAQSNDQRHERTRSAQSGPAETIS